MNSTAQTAAAATFGSQAAMCRKISISFQSFMLKKISPLCFNSDKSKRSASFLWKPHKMRRCSVTPLHSQTSCTSRGNRKTHLSHTQRGSFSSPAAGADPGPRHLRLGLLHNPRVHHLRAWLLRRSASSFLCEKLSLPPQRRTDEDWKG